MDVVLEVFDSFVFDYVYATALPKNTAPFSLIGDVNSNITTGYNATSYRQFSSWEYQPSTKFFHIEPSNSAYMSAWDRDNTARQAMSLFLITWIFGLVVYFIFATLSYVFIFDKDTFKHPKFLKNQIRMEISQTAWSLPGMAVLTTPFFLAEVMGYSKLYDSPSDGPGLWYDILQFPFFLIFTDFFIYWIHRGLHHPKVYKQLHKPHHKWIMPSPYASHAFHPIDGFSQSLPYHIFPFLFPLQKFAYVFLFMFINIWTIMIHDGEYVANSPIINGAACHTMHHLYFNYNYGQYTTLWDRLGGSYRPPNEELFRRETKMDKKEWDRQTKEMEKIVKEVEGEDDRGYLPEENAKKNN